MHLFAVPNLPLIQPGDDLASLIVEGLASAGETLQSGDILVVAQKIVSKAEGRLVRLNDVVPTAEAEQIAITLEKDPRVVQVILNDSRSILRMRKHLFIVEQNGGWICANAGVDRSNIQANGENDEVIALLPTDADASAEQLRQALYEQTGVLPAVIINDSHGRPWRVGTVGVTLGCAGLPPIWDQRGLSDLFGYTLKTSEECIADELAAAASLLMGQSREGRPVVVIRGYQLPDAAPAPARTIQRAAATDAFR